MRGKFWLSVVVLFVVWSALDWFFHGVVMTGYYEASKDLWRSEEAMNAMMPLMWLVTLIASFFFVLVFSKGYEGKGIGEGVRFGLYIGLWFGSSMGLGSYTAMPITGAVALGWFLITVIECVTGGAVVAALHGRGKEITS
ncbi:MAG: hypothetical protein ABIK65_01970 [Candidatus Eisenbacteria bacterium]